MAPVQRIGQTEDPSKNCQCFPVLSVKIFKVSMIILGERPAVVAGHVGDQFDLIDREPGQVAILDDVVGMLVMLA